MKSASSLELKIVVLAAGFSARLGQPKALAKIHGRTVLGRAIRTLSRLRAGKIIVVIPPRAARYKACSPLGSVAFVVNADRAAGLAGSVRVGLRRARHSAGVLLLPVDLVELRYQDIARLIARWRAARRRVVARRVDTRRVDARRGVTTRVDAQAGAPLILPRWLYPRAMEIGGDVGLRDLARGLPRDAVALTDLPSAEADVDTPQDLQRARRRIRPTQ